MAASPRGSSICYTRIVVVVFVESAFKHGYGEEDSFEVLGTEPLKLRSRGGLKGVYELLGRNYVGEYLRCLRSRTRPGSRVPYTCNEPP